jgi:hypothetical protein
VAAPKQVLSELNRVLAPGGVLRIGFGPPWLHAHGKHFWEKLPGWWSHVLFSQRACMHVAGFPSETTWEDLGLNKMTVRRFRRLMGSTDLECLTYYERSRFNLAKRLPFVKEFLVGGLGGVWRKSPAG